MKKLIVAGNWKLYISDQTVAKKLASTIKRKAALFPGLDVVLFPPATLLSLVAGAVTKSLVSVGGQTVSPFGQGAYTGYLSARALKDAGATWTLIGHSERRAQTLDGLEAAHETEGAVQAQVQSAQEVGLKVLLCIGEVERDPSGAHFAAISRQLSSALATFPKTGAKLGIAYEPVWAIGKPSTDAMKPADLEEMVIFIRRTLTEVFDRAVATKIPILYGGSVDATNARELVKAGVSGFLVGRASTDAGSFLELLKSCKL